MNTPNNSNNSINSVEKNKNKNKSNFFNKAKNKIKTADKRHILFLIIIFLLAFAIRGHLLQYEYMFGFDSYYHARVGEVILTNGSLPAFDEQGYYFLEDDKKPNFAGGELFWYVSTLIYSIFSLGAPYSKELWIFFVKFLPAFYGALISLAMYWFGKDMFNNRNIGYATALVAAVIPAFVYRTMAGFFEEDSLGFLWMVIGFVFFIRAMKSLKLNKNTVVNAVLAGVFFAIMSYTWDVFMLIPMVLFGYFVFGGIFVFAKKPLSNVKAFVVNFLVSFLVFVGLASLNGTNWITTSFNYVFELVPFELIIVGLIGLIILVGVLFYIRKTSDSKEFIENKNIQFIAMAVLYLVVISAFVLFLVVEDPRSSDSIIAQTVGEESLGNRYFANKYNGLIVFAVVGLFLIPWRVFRNKNAHLSIIILFWVLISLVMAWYKLKFTYTLGLPIAAITGLVLNEALFYAKRWLKENSFEAQSLVVPVLFLIMVGMASAAIFVPDNIPSIELAQNNSWKNMLSYMSDEFSSDTKIMNWWDQGHWISFVGEVKVSSDNRNYSGVANEAMAKFIIEDVNSGLNSVNIIKPDYILLDNSMFSKMHSYAVYAYSTLNFSDPRIQPFTLAQSGIISCSRSDSSSTVFACSGGTSLSYNDISSMPYKWVSTPNYVPQGSSIGFYLYRDANIQNKNQITIYLLTPAVNNSNMAKVWFSSDEVSDYYSLKYDSDGIRLFEVKPEAFS